MSVIDLHAADAQYHFDCYQTFTSKRNIIVAANKLNKKCTEDPDTALSEIFEEMIKDKARIWTSIELHKLYVLKGGILQRRTLVTAIQEHFNTVVVLKVGGCANIIGFKEYTWLYIT